MEKIVEVLVWENKENEGRFLAAGLQNGDEEDANCDNGMERIEYCFISTSKKPHMNNLEYLVAGVKNELEVHEKFMVDRFGPDAHVSLKYSDLIKHYTPKMISIPFSKFVAAMYLDRNKSLILGGQHENL